MADKREIRLLILTLVFLATCGVVYTRQEAPAAVNKPPIRQFFAHLDGYTARQIELPQNASDMLRLDDYAYADYQGTNGTANLYIGYYYTAAKAYAAHSPTICFPSQGWAIDRQPTIHSLDVGPHRIHYEEIVTSQGEKKELVLYWYQSRLLTNTQVYRNKIAMGYNKFAYHDQQHAFVRVSVPFTDPTTYADAKTTAIEFIRDFYPKFIDFILVAGHNQPAPSER